MVAQVGHLGGGERRAGVGVAQSSWRIWRYQDVRFRRADVGVAAVAWAVTSSARGRSQLDSTSGMKGGWIMSAERRHGPRLPPRWFVRLAWYVHRGLYRVTGGRVGLWRPKAKGWGALRLTATGRRTGRERNVIIGYFEDGPNLIGMAMNGWADGEPAGGSTCKRILMRE
jgi:hypothetical protein